MIRFLNLAALSLALGLSWAITQRFSADVPTEADHAEEVVASASDVSEALAPDGPDESPSIHGDARALRIVSASGVADQVLAEIAVPSHVVAISSAAVGTATWRFGDRPRIQRLADLEAIIALRPDVVFASAIGGDRSVARLREAGVEVISLGQLEGFASLPTEIRRIGARIGAFERADQYATTLQGRFERLRDQGTLARGIYLSVYGAHLYGGTSGSSFGDVLSAGGVEDIAAAHGHHGWPEYTAEELLRMDPPLIVMPEGGPEALCRLEAAASLSACEHHRFVTMPLSWIGDPGPRLVDAAERLRAALSTSPNP